jgi:hypothetical protein
MDEEKAKTLEKKECGVELQDAGLNYSLRQF